MIRTLTVYLRSTMNKKLIEVHSEKPQMEHCACCDGESKLVTKFYKELEGSYFGFQTYLDCCVSQVGEVVDWYNLEDYNKKVKMYKLGNGIGIAEIKGYKNSK